MPSRSRPAAILAVTLLAPLLDGGSPPWASAVILVLGAAVIAIWPPQSAPPKPIGALLLIAAALPGLAYLPATLTSSQPWRTGLAESVDIQLATTTTPQPWVTFDAWILFAGALLWLYYLACQRWTDQDRSFLVRGLTVGIASIATLSLAFKAIDIQPTLWTNPDQFGPFANRNRFASLLAVGAVLVATVTKESYDKRDIRWLYWPLVSAPLFAAIIVNGSRAGLLLFFAGLLAWLIVSLSTHSPSRTLALGSAVVLIFASAFFLFGGNLRDRLLTSGIIGAGFDSTHRLLIYKDVPRIIDASPVVGHGLGNFDSVFTYHREASLDILRTRVMHPENDLLWLATEGGVPLLIAALFIIAAFVYRALPLRQSDSRRIARPVRVGATVACSLILVHGVIDIPAHVPGVFLTLALLASIALAKFRPQPLRWIRLLFRSATIPFALVGCLWIVSQSTSATLPGATAAARYSDWELTGPVPVEALDRAIAARPLDWQLYFNRAKTQLAGGRNDAAALDFERARQLAPESMKMASAEAELWQSVDPPSATSAWRFIIEQHEDYSLAAYRDMLEVAQDHPEVMATAEELAKLRPGLLITYLQHRPREEFIAYLDKLLKTDPALRTVSADYLPTLFKVWYAKGNRELLLSSLGTYQGWWEAGWLIAAKDFASKKQFQQAVEIGLANSRRPPVTDLADHRNYAELRRDFILDPTDALTGLYLFGAQRRAGALKDAIDTINKVGQLEDAPPYVAFYEAEIYSLAKRWQEAWIRLEKYNRAYPPH